jgi:hypothetical protein
MQTVNEDAALSVERFFEALKHHSDLHRAFRPSHNRKNSGSETRSTVQINARADQRTCRSTHVRINACADQRTAATAAFIAETMAR